VVEIEPLVARGTEYRCHTRRCTWCGQSTTAALPQGYSAFSERLRARACLLSGQYHLSQRPVQQVLEDRLGVKLSLGRVARLSQQRSRALEGPAQKAEAFVRQQAVVNADETGGRKGCSGTERAWPGCGCLPRPWG
jgi:hypothetical protein